MILGMPEESIGERTRRLRKARGLTQNQLAFDARVDPSTVARLEQGKRTPDTDTLGSIAAVLEVPISELLGTEVSGADEPTILYQSLRTFLDKNAELKVTDSERRWLASQRFPDDSGEGVPPGWWMGQLFAYRGLTRPPSDQSAPEPLSRRPTRRR